MRSIWSVQSGYAYSAEYEKYFVTEEEAMAWYVEQLELKTKKSSVGMHDYYERPTEIKINENFRHIIREDIVSILNFKFIERE